ncbi:MAG: hypothetical protein R3232_00545 [Clostridia bacterium]|nr:hypothetical protein [Clostridia bacterium]
MKKKIMFITTVAIIIALAATGTALAANGNGEGTGEPVAAADGNGNGYGRASERGTGQRFAVQAEMYETEEEYHAAVLAQKLEILDSKVEDGSLSAEDAAIIREHLTSCDGTCESEGENPDKPAEGWGIFGQSNQGRSSEMKGSGNGYGNRAGANGEGEKAEGCDEEEPLRSGNGSEEGFGKGNR